MLKLLLKLVPITVDIALLETVLVLHSFFEDLHESPYEDPELLVFRLLAEGKLIGERLWRLLVLFFELGVEVQLLSLVVDFAVHRLFIYYQ